MATKTINLTGAEVAVTGLDGAHAHIRNDGTEVIYAAKTAGITAGADGVASIPAGQADTVRGISGTVYLLGTGSALIQSDDYVVSPFKTSAQGSGSGADEVARAAINTHSGNAEIHVSAEEKAAWNGKAEVSDISNPNLLINPDFSINQRGQSEYTSLNGHNVDGWFSSNAKVSVGDGYVTVETPSATQVASLRQIIEISPKLVGKTITLTADCDVLEEGSRCCIQLKYNNAWTPAEYFTETGRHTISRSFTLPEELTTTVDIAIMIQTPLIAGVIGKIKVYSVKLEVGSFATPFCPPDPATELAKCQRYYQIRSTGDIPAVDLRPSMRDTPTITQLSDGNYAYSAEL